MLIGIYIPDNVSLHGDFFIFTGWKSVKLRTLSLHNKIWVYLFIYLENRTGPQTVSLYYKVHFTI